MYASSTVALATLEMLVHLDSTVPLPAYRLIEAAIPQSLITAVPANALPHNWRNYPAPPELRILGDNWLQSGDSAVLKVPSALVAVEFNYVINPQHPDFPLITTATAVSFPVDARLL